MAKPHPPPAAPLPDHSLALEQQALKVGLGANLFMGAAGILAALLSNSDALLVDGLYSLINFFAAIVAARVAASITRAPDHRRPFGYDADEALYILFRSLILIGILTFAAGNSALKIYHYLTGGEVPELHFGPIFVYVLLMVLTCGFLAIWYHHHWKLAKERSELLKTERNAATVDGLLSAGTGAALLGVNLLRGTALEGLIPISDAIVVFVLAALMIRGPVTMLRSAVSDVAGESVGPAVTRRVRERIAGIPASASAKLLDVAVTKLGRTHFVIVYVRPGESFPAFKLDSLRVEILNALTPLFPQVRCEVIYTAQSPLQNPESSSPQPQ